ncbi:MAG TPA: hypothetical protein VF116_01930 [Ktedonobacterales bacterium]
MTTHITLTTLIVFVAMVAFGAVVFALAHFASRGAFSPDVSDDENREEAAPEPDDDAGSELADALTRTRKDQAEDDAR